MKENLEFDYPRTIDDVVRKACICYQQMKQKSEGSKGEMGRRGRNLPPSRQKKITNGRNIQQRTFSKFPKNGSKVPAYNENGHSKGVSKPTNDQQPKQPLQCWGCGESHYYKNFPHRART